MVAIATQETYLPEAGSEAAVAEVYDFFRAHDVPGQLRPRYFLSGEGDQVEIPPGVYRILKQVVEAMKMGLAVTIAPQAQKLTTQQAAELLGISRPTLVKLLDDGRIPFERVGAHRRVLLRDVLQYREERRREQYAALEASAVDLDVEENLEGVLAELRVARRQVAERRRQARQSDARQK
jgi:excisionase family DNA binding protein